MSDIENFVNGNQEILTVLLVVILLILLLWNIYLHFGLLKIKKRSRIFFDGRGAKDLEDVIYGQVKKTDGLGVEIKKLIESDKKIREDLSKCIQKVGVVKFNPFNNVGGSQSFAIALLDNYLDGVIILSLYSRDGVRIYSRPVKEGKSELALSKEEEEAIKLASSK